LNPRMPRRMAWDSPPYDVLTGSSYDLIMALRFTNLDTIPTGLKGGYR
jgi:hypothetical protein